MLCNLKFVIEGCLLIFRENSFIKKMQSDSMGDPEGT